MKRKNFLLGFLLLGSLSWSQEDQKAMRVTYTLTTTTSFNLSEDAEAGISLYDKIRLMPMVTQDHFTELIFADGSIEKSILHSFPNGLPEDWLVKPSHTMITKDSAFVYVGDVIFSRMAVEPQEKVSAKEAAPYYLATPLFQLPLSERELHGLESEGAIILTNNELILEYQIDETSYYYNSFLLIEETSTGNEFQDFQKTTTAYKRDSLGHILIDYQVDRLLQFDSTLNDYLESVSTTEYSSIIREFLIPSLEPKIEKLESDIKPCLSASQLGETQEILVKFDEFCEVNEFLIRVMDLHGNVKMENIRVSRDYPTFFAENLDFGVHIIESLEHPVPSCSFLYMP